MNVSKVLIAAWVTGAVFWPGGTALGRQNPDVVAVRLEIQERAHAMEDPDARVIGDFHLAMEAVVSGADSVETVGVDVGSLRLDVPLVSGRFRGIVDISGSRVFVTARARGDSVHLQVRGSLSKAPDGVIGPNYLFGCREGLFWDGMVYGMHPVTLRFGGTSLDGILAVVGRSAWVTRPRRVFGSARENDLTRVTLRGAATFPALSTQGPLLLTVPERQGVRWCGRVRGCVVAAETIPTASVAGRGGATRLLSPLNSEALDFGIGENLAPGVQVIESGGIPVYQVLFDAAVPEAIDLGRLRLSAGTESGGTVTLNRPVVGPDPVPVVDLDVGVHVLEARSDATVWGWGGNFNGELGDGTKRVPTRPVRSLLPSRAVSVSTGQDFSLAIDEEGRAWWWGRLTFGDIFGRIGISSQFPEPIRYLPARIREMAAGPEHALALDSSGRVWAWGGNVYGELGDGTIESRARPAQVIGLPAIVGIAAGNRLSVALDADGRIWAWGDYRFRSSQESTLPVVVQGLPAAKQVRAKGVVLVLAVDGQVWAWGPNFHGEVGDGTTERREDPVPVTGMDRVVALDAGDFHSVALRDDGTVWAWGENSEGQLGDGTGVDRWVPVQTRDLRDIVMVGAGDFRTVAVDARGYQWGWGQVSPLATGVVGLRRGGTGVYPQLLRRSSDDGYGND